MEHIIFAIVLVAHAQCAKLDHLKYLPPDNRPTKPESFDQGLSAPKSYGFSSGNPPEGLYLGPNPLAARSDSIVSHGYGSTFVTPEQPSGSKTAGESLDSSSHHVSQPQGSPNGNQKSKGYSDGYSTGSQPSGSGSVSASFHGSNQPQVGSGTQGSPNANEPSGSYSGESPNGYSTASQHSGPGSVTTPLQESSQPQNGYSVQGSSNANQPSAGYFGTPSYGYSSGPQYSGSKSFGSSFQQSNQPQVGFGAQRSPNANQPSTGYSGASSNSYSPEPQPTGSGLFRGSSFQPTTSSTTFPRASGRDSAFSQSSNFAKTEPSSSVAPDLQASGISQSQGNNYGKTGADSAPFDGRQPASGYSGPYQYKYHSSSQNQIPIIRLDAKNYGDGSYSTIYETGNGIQATEEGKTQGDTSLVQGAFSYTSPKGDQIGVSYTADENGYHPQGDNIPTPPPIPEAILRSIKYNEAHPEQENDDGSYKVEDGVESGRQYQNLAGNEKVSSSSRQYLIPKPAAADTNQFSGKTASGSSSSSFSLSKPIGTSPVSSGYAPSSTFSSNEQQRSGKALASQTPTPGQLDQYQSSGPFSGVSGSLKHFAHSQTQDPYQGISVNQRSSSDSGKSLASSGGQGSFSSSFKNIESQAPYGGSAIGSATFNGAQGQTSNQFRSQTHTSVPFSSNGFGPLSPSGSPGYAPGQQVPKAHGNGFFGPSSTSPSPGGFQPQGGAQASSEPKHIQSHGGRPSLQHGSTEITQQSGRSPNVVPGTQGPTEKSARAEYQYNNPAVPFGASGSQQKGSSSRPSEGANGRHGVQKGAGEFGPGFARNHVSPSKTPGVQAQDENGGYIY